MLEKGIITVCLLIACFNSIAQIKDSSAQGKKSTYKIEVDDKIRNSTSIEFVIKDEANHPMQGFIGLRNKENKPILMYLSDKEGKANLLLFDLTNIEFITVDYIGYDRIFIPIKDIKNRSSKTEITLHAQEIID